MKFKNLILRFKFKNLILRIKSNNHIEQTNLNIKPQNKT